MKFDDRSYLKAYDHNYRVAYEEGLTYLGEGASQQRDLQRLKGLLQRIPHSPRRTKLLDLGCGDGTIGLFLARLGYQYVGIDISEAAIERARQRAAENDVGARFEVENVLDLHTFQTNGFRSLSTAIASTCWFSMLTEQRTLRMLDESYKTTGISSFLVSAMRPRMKVRLPHSMNFAG